MRVIHDWFGFPDGAVLTNLVASLLWAGVAIRKLFQIHRTSELARHHAEQAHAHAAQAHAHAKAAHEHVKQAL